MKERTKKHVDIFVYVGILVYVGLANSAKLMILGGRQYPGVCWTSKPSVFFCAF